MPKYEKISFMEADDVNFVGVPIYYDSACVNQDPKSNIVESTINVTTDLEYIINNPDAISDDGFVILCNYVNAGLYYVEINAGPLGTTMKLNMRLSVASLHNAYFRHHRVLIDGYLNGTLTTFWTAKKTKIQECSAILCEEFDPNEEITTELGESYFGGVKGTVRRAEIKATGEIKLNLIYGPEDNINTGVPEVRKIIIRQADIAYDDPNSTLYAFLNIDADMDIVILIRETIYHDDMSVHCVGDWESWTIPTGSFTDDFTFAMCAMMQDVPGGCIGFEFDLTGAGSWTIEFIPDPNYVC